MSASQEATEHPVAAPIMLRAPDGAAVWTIIELQGSVVCSAGTSLNGLQFAKLSWEPNCVRHALAHRARPHLARPTLPARLS